MDMKKRTLLILLLVMSLLLTGCQSNDSLVAQAKIAWANSGAPGTPEEYAVHHLHFDDVSVLKSKITNWKDYDWMPASGDIFIFFRHASDDSTCYDVFLSESGEVRKVYTLPDTENLNVFDFASIDDMLFFTDIDLWWISEEKTNENVSGQWHSLTEKQIKQLDQ